METVPQHYMDQAISGLNQYVVGMYPIQRYRLASGEIRQLIKTLNDPWYALGTRGDLPNLRIVDNAGTHWADMTVHGNVIEVDSRPALSADRPIIAQTVFWQRFWGVLFWGASVSATPA